MYTATLCPCSAAPAASLRPRAVRFSSRVICVHLCRVAVSASTTMSDEDEDPVDPKLEQDEKCGKTPACAKLLAAYEQCSERIDAKGSGQCSGQYMDFVGCVDNCVRLPVLEPFASL